jgi:8-oxo-dGTP pyrophosphatase MutT (NUDIX family)
MAIRPYTFLTNASQSVTGFLSAIGFLRPPVMQLAAICYRTTDTGVEVLLITSLGTGQWLIPKGWPKKNQSSNQTALEEAFEEAGVIGDISEEPMGEYRYQKTNKVGVPLNCVASVYEVAVTGMAENFPEAGRRQHVWLAPELAAKKVSHTDLARLLAQFEPSHTLQ